jgi:hypothetical protein
VSRTRESCHSELTPSMYTMQLERGMNTVQVHDSTDRLPLTPPCGTLVLHHASAWTSDCIVRFAFNACPQA